MGAGAKFAAGARKPGWIWIPSTAGERTINLVAFVLVLVLVSLGFEVLKLPSTIAPDVPTAARAFGVLFLISLNLTLMWTIARDDYLRFSHGFPKTVLTLAVLTIGASIAMLARGLLAKNYVIDPELALDCRKIVEIAIGSQLVAMTFCATYLFKKTDNAKVREFKRFANSTREFVVALGAGELAGRDFESAFKKTAPDMKALTETARLAVPALDCDEASYAVIFAKAAKDLAERLEMVPTVAIPATVEELGAEENSPLAVIVGSVNSKISGKIQT